MGMYSGTLQKNNNSVLRFLKAESSYLQRTQNVFACTHPSSLSHFVDCLPLHRKGSAICIVSLKILDNEVRLLLHLRPPFHDVGFGVLIIVSIKPGNEFALPITIKQRLCLRENFEQPFVVPFLEWGGKD